LLLLWDRLLLVRSLMLLLRLYLLCRSNIWPLRSQSQL